MVLHGEHVVLRPLTFDDLDTLEAAFAEPAVALWWPRFDRARIESVLVHADDRHAGIDIAVATRWHGQGIAVDALRTVMRHLVHGEGHRGLDGTFHDSLLMDVLAEEIE